MMIEARNLTKYYGHRPVVTDVSFGVDAGEAVGFLGVNGAGKSTTLRMITGYMLPTSGSAWIAGNLADTLEARRSFGYLPESNPLPKDMRVHEFLRMRAKLKEIARRGREEAMAKAAESCRISDMMDRLIGTLSKGYRQRVGLADAILASPKILILDEPTTGLDPAQAAETCDLIRDLSQTNTVLFSSHILSEVEKICRRVVFINRGTVAADIGMSEISDLFADERVVVMEILSPEPVREVLRAIPGVKVVLVGERELDGAVKAKVTMTAGVDVRRELAQACLRRGWLVREMRLEPIRLEDVFHKLTRGRTAVKN